jgi:hypothetical protein
MEEQTYPVLVSKRRDGEIADVPPETLSAIVEDYPDKILAEVTAAQHQALSNQGYMVEDLRERTSIRVGALAIDPTTPEEAEAARALAEDEEGIEPEYFFVQFVGPVKQQWVESLNQANLTPLAYYHDFTYLVHGKRTDVEDMAKNSYVRGTMPYGASVRLSAEARSQLEEEAGPPAQEYEILIFTTGGDVEQTLGRLRGLGVNVLEEAPPHTFYQKFRVYIPEEAFREVTRVAGVYHIEPYYPIVPTDEVADQIVAGNLSAANQPQTGYQNWLNQLGVDGTGITIGINEANEGGATGGIDQNHPAFAGRVTQVSNSMTTHGTMVAGQAAANYVTAQAPEVAADLTDANGFLYGLGIAPGANLLSQSVNAVDSAQDCVATAGPNGVNGSIINNSWGSWQAFNPIDYQQWDQSWDEDVRDANPAIAGNTPLMVCFAAGNSGNNGLGRPAGAKNVVTSGNFENFRPNLNYIPPGGAVSCVQNDADNINQRYVRSCLDSGTGPSSIGTCGDGRVKPDIVAPGQWTASAAFPQPSAGARSISHWLRYGGGTSAASPKIAGACALIVQWWLQRYTVSGLQRTPPSPAMAKAMVINGAVDTGEGGRIPNPQQGWGRIHLSNTLTPDTPVIRMDQKHTLQPASADVVIDLTVADSTRPLRITVVWTDVPGTVNTGTAGNPALVNSLGVQVTQVINNVPTTWFGNNFANGSSQPGGVQDAIQNANPNQVVNNVQNVFIQNHPLGTTYRLRITPANIIGDCLAPANAFANPASFQQDFALVIQNARLTRTSIRDVAECCLQKAGSLSLKDDIFEPGQSAPLSLKARMELILSAC